MLPAVLANALPPGARRVDRHDGFRLDLGPLGRVEVRERRRPQESVGRILRGLAAELGRGTMVGPIERLVTREGESAAVALLSGDGATMFAGVVFGDDFYRLVIAGGDDVVSIARRIVLELPLGLAHRRRRWYGYVPPADWGCLRRHTFIAEWIAPGFPGEHAMITMFPARPAGESGAGAFDRHLHEMGWGGYKSMSVEGPAKVHTASQLGGVRWQLVGAWLDGARTHTEVVLLSDDTFFYWMRLDHDGDASEAHRDLFSAVVDSVEPVPPARPSDKNLNLVID